MSAALSQNAKADTRLGFKALSEHVGVEVVGLDLKKEFSADTAAALRQAFLDHHLLVVRQLDVSEDDQIRFARIFGEVTIRRRYDNGPANPLAQYVSNARKDGILGDGEINFHMDHVFFEHPLSAIILYGLEIPASGSVTKFRNSEAVLKNLPADLRARCEGVRCLHLFNYEGDYTTWQDPAKAPADSPRAWQPLVWRHPQTGRESLWLSPINAVDFEGISREEGFKLLQDLQAYTDSIEAYEYAHDWAVGDLVIWSNRTLHHKRMPFDASEKRTLRRTPIV